MQPHNQTFEAIGTQWEITSMGKLPEQLLADIHTRIEAFDKTYSRFRRDSLVRQIIKTSGVFTFPDDASPLFDFYEDLYDITDGKVTPLIGDVLEQAGYDSTYSFNPHNDLSTVPKWEDSIIRSDTTLSASRPLTLDFGAAGKGYLVDIIGRLLEQTSIKDYVIDASGDLRQRGSIDNRVGLEHPLDTTKVIGVVDIKDESLCASASNRRKWGAFHHIMDPSTKQPVREVIASWVIAGSTIVADGIATALFFAEPRRLAEKYDFQYVRMHADGSFDYSKNFKGDIF
jgi:FAD:protein FMN transferase